MSFFTQDQLDELDANWIRRDGTNTATGEVEFVAGLKTNQILGNPALNIQSAGIMTVQGLQANITGTESAYVASDGDVEIEAAGELELGGNGIEFSGQVNLPNGLRVEGGSGYVELSTDNISVNRKQYFTDGTGSIQI